MNQFGEAWKLIFSGSEVFKSIILTTLEMAAISSTIAFLLGIIIGTLLSYFNFKGRSILITINRVLMGMPPVVLGIILYVLFSGTGPFGKLNLIYSLPLMIIAQVCLITPIASGMTESSLSPRISTMKPTMKGLQLSPGMCLGLTMFESKYSLIAVYLFAFARAMAEVGAVQIVGGNILYKTRVMTTAIALNYNTGDFALAIALGLVLLLITLIVNVVAAILQYCFRSQK